MVFGAAPALADAPRDSELAVLERYRPLPVPRPRADQAATRRTRIGRWRIPEWRLLRVHSTGPVSSYRSNDTQHLLECDADLEAGQVRAETEMDPVAERQVWVRVTAEAEGHPVR